MTQFRATIKEAVEKWNERNPEKREITLTSLSEKIGTSKQWVSQLNSLYKDQLERHSQVIFMTDDELGIGRRWEQYTKLKNDKLIERLEKIRIELGCEVWDLIEKTEANE